jgi:hypothetical protein
MNGVVRAPPPGIGTARNHLPRPGMAWCHLLRRRGTTWCEPLRRSHPGHPCRRRWWGILQVGRADICVVNVVKGRGNWVTGGAGT